MTNVSITILRLFNLLTLVITRESQVQHWFELSNVRAFASTHTCLPVAQQYDIPSMGKCSVINNGSAGMPNFKGTTFGLMTRIAVKSKHEEKLKDILKPLYGMKIEDLEFQAVPVYPCWRKAVYCRDFMIRKNGLIIL